MRFAMGIGCVLLMSLSCAHAFELNVQNLNKMPNAALLSQVNKKLAQQQVKDGQFEFKTGKAEFAPGNDKRIKGLLRIINDNSSALKKTFPHLKVVSEGHTDADGRADANKKLSLARANKVCKELKAQGMSLPCKQVGVGSSKPLVSPEKSAADKQRNRRVLVQLAE